MVVDESAWIFDLRWIAFKFKAGGSIFLAGDVFEVEGVLALEICVIAEGGVRGLK